MDLKSCPLLLCHSDFWFSPLTISGILLWCRGIVRNIVLIGTVRDFLFAHTGFWTWDLWISSPALYYWAMVILVFTSDKFRYITLVQRHWWCFCSDWSFESFSLCPHWDLTWGPLDLKACTLPLCHMTSGFHLWQFQVFNCGAEGLVVLLFWLDLWEIFFLHWLVFELGTSGFQVLHSTTLPWWFWFSFKTITGI